MQHNFDDLPLKKWNVLALLSTETYWVAPKRQMPTRSAVSFLSRARVPLPLCPFVSLPSANATIASRLSAAMPAQEQNYWLETLNAPSVEAAPDLPENVDVAIVGGGFCGLSAARALAKRGVRAAVLEAELHASHRTSTASKNPPRSSSANSVTNYASFPKATCAAKSARTFISAAWWTKPARG